MIKRISPIVLLIAAFLPQWIAPASGAGADVQQTWRQLSPLASPDGRIDPVMAYDAAASQHRAGEETQTAILPQPAHPAKPQFTAIMSSSEAVQACPGP